MKILILGSQGNLGQDLVSGFSAAGHEVVGCDRDELDVTDQAATWAMIGYGFSVVNNAVAYNNVDGAKDPARHAPAPHGAIPVGGLPEAREAAAVRGAQEHEVSAAAQPPRGTEGVFSRLPAASLIFF